MSTFASRRLEHRLVELGFGQELLQPGVLCLELLQALGVTRLHAAVLGQPAVPGRLGDLQVPADLVEFGPAGQELVAFGELADDLVGGMPPTFGHGAVLLRSSLEHWTRTTPGPLPGDQLTTASRGNRGFLGRDLGPRSRYWCPTGRPPRGLPPGARAEGCEVPLFSQKDDRSPITGAVRSLMQVGRYEILLAVDCALHGTCHKIQSSGDQGDLEADHIRNDRNVNVSNNQVDSVPPPTRFLKAQDIRSEQNSVDTGWSDKASTLPYGILATCAGLGADT